jgi:hypothetical protein
LPDTEAKAGVVGGREMRAIAKGSGSKLEWFEDWRGRMEMQGRKRKKQYKEHAGKRWPEEQTLRDSRVSMGE